MTYAEASALLTTHGQPHVLAHWKSLTAEAQSDLLKQIDSLDFAAIDAMKAMLARPTVKTSEPEPGSALSLSIAEHDAAASLGADALRLGKVGVILVAGGQGTRLGFDGPKGTYPIGPMSNASLFEIHARKIAALERRFDAKVPFYIMTSAANDADTRAFFGTHSNFGLSSDRVKFFIQGMLPALFPDGRLVMETSGRLFMSPDGHGGILQALRRTHMLNDMNKRGLETLFYFQVDNPLVEIADPVFIGLHRERQAQFSLKVCAKRDPAEGLGVIARHGQSGLTIVEYTELTQAQKEARTPSGDLRFKFGSVAIHVFALDFLTATAEAGLPLHTAHKKVPCFDDGRMIAPDKPNAFKFEKFIFDALPLAKRAVALEFDRAEEFSPVKNASGADSPNTTRLDMVRKFARWFEACGVIVPRNASGDPQFKIEIDPRYASCPEELRTRLPKGYTIQGDTWLKCLESGI
jgi:UDP-N-acetylglucosamine/UDP-N-acetylgalactosamine diphosphorylase